jgi:hypothetical protein
MHLDYNQYTDNVLGFVDFGKESAPNDELAREALVFMAVGLKQEWKMTLANFFISRINGISLAQLINEAIARLDSIGIRVISVTLDGCAANISAMSALGCKLQALENSFVHPVNPSQRVYIYWDPCHMLKLLRNMLGDWKVLYTRDGPVRWRHIEDLHAYQVREGLSAANKISERHLQYERQKMKVSGALLVLSLSLNFLVVLR